MPVEKKKTTGQATSNDVEMKDANAENEKPAEETKAEPKKDPDTLCFEDLREQMRQIERMVATKETRYMYRIVRSLPSTRRRLNSNVMRRFLQLYYPTSSSQRSYLLAFIDEPMETNGTPAASPATTGSSRVKSAANASTLPELDMYAHLLVLLFVLGKENYTEAVKCSDALMDKIVVQNRRTLDILAAKCYYFHSRAYELTKKLVDIRNFLHMRLRTATLRSDFEGQAVLVNLLLRNYLHYELYDQADKLVARSNFPESANNNEWARFLYYLGIIKAIKLNYSEAHKKLMQAIRKAPQHSAIGFKQMAQKFAIVVELLLGEIPERSIFRQPSLTRTLQPYFRLTQAVMAGNLPDFNEVLTEFNNRFKNENTWTLIIRLRHNVIKNRVRQINVSYSRISLRDIAIKLGLDRGEDAEFIVAKAIRDGVIEANVDQTNKCMQSREVVDIYSTAEPQNAFHQRIAFCLDTHNQSVKAMRYPDKAYQKDLESAEERREREQQDLELAKEMADDDDDAFQ